MKHYEKGSNGKYGLVDKQEGSIVIENQGPKIQPLSIEERLVRLERIVLDPRK
jgi:hypothetical protein